MCWRCCSYAGAVGVGALEVLQFWRCLRCSRLGGTGRARGLDEADSAHINSVMYNCLLHCAATYLGHTLLVIVISLLSLSSKFFLNLEFGTY